MTHSAHPLDRLGERLGEGGEAEVFAHASDPGRVVRRFKGTPRIDGRLDLTARVAEAARVRGLRVAVPEVLDRGERDGVVYTVERRLPGRALTEVLDEVEGDERTVLLDDYLDVATALSSLPWAPPGWHGDLVAEGPLRTASWCEYLHAKLDAQVASAAQAQRAAVPALDAVVAELHVSIDRIVIEREVTSGLVHFDLFPGNVLSDGRRITAVIDWSVLCLYGDTRLDPCLAVAYFELVPHRASDLDTLRAGLRDRGLLELAQFYRRWVAAWWLPATGDSTLHRWVVRVLSEPPPAVG